MDCYQMNRTHADHTDHVHVFINVLIMDSLTNISKD